MITLMFCFMIYNKRIEEGWLFLSCLMDVLLALAIFGNH